MSLLDCGLKASDDAAGVQELPVCPLHGVSLSFMEAGLRGSVFLDGGRCS